ncbi:MAG: SCO family protein [Geobacteraceae bacterium]|nr:SCO family protein [Geobacteraceae bacterium]
MLKMMTAVLRFLSIMVLCLFFTGTAFAAKSEYRRTIEHYAVPDVVLVNQDGHKVHLKTYLQSNNPVVVEFIFGTCTTICPILSAGYANLQQKLGADVRNVKLVSISIDPEHDTPNVMKEYLKKYRAKPGWDFLTGSRSDIDKVMYAFNAYIPNKMSHFPLTLFRSPSDGSWIRIFGLMSSSEFLNEFHKVAKK